MEQDSLLTSKITLRRNYSDPYFIILCIIVLLVTAAYFLKEITIISGLLLMLFGSITAFSFYSLLELVIGKKDTIGIERGLPSVDGNVGGWKLTRALTMLIIALIFTIPTMVILGGINDNAKKVADVVKNAEKKTAEHKKNDSTATNARDSIK
jgi:hypothetical protein